MDKSSFGSMWESMQQNGYFSRHPHYQDYFGGSLSSEDKDLDNAILKLNFSAEHVEMPAPYSDVLERSVKRTESVWLGRMFDLPTSGTVLDVGCGFGRSVAWLSERYEQVIGTDISPAAIDGAKARFSHQENVRFMVNESDRIPEEIAERSIDLTYIFTVFQHIPRDFATSILKSVERALNDDGIVIFNLLSNTNEHIDDGELEQEWSIGYSQEQALEMLSRSNLAPLKICTWSAPESGAGWLWIAAGKNSSQSSEIR
ncbi:MAG: methyltransferase domain-containing protein [Gammaproteobacteria bacterium]|nr:methyltransferase domain-containing protein [Gammaproteobacteria bacterium]MDP2346966.1 methyltransferase domain-containing protein [Gammaproteobacteria bacterium]